MSTSTSTIACIRFTGTWWHSMALKPSGAQHIIDGTSLLKSVSECRKTSNTRSCLEFIFIKARALIEERRSLKNDLFCFPSKEEGPQGLHRRSKIVHQNLKQYSTSSVIKNHKNPWKKPTKSNVRNLVVN